MNEKEINQIIDQTALQVKVGLIAVNKAIDKEVANAIATAQKTMFNEYLEAGFTREEAIELIISNSMPGAITGRK